MGFSRGSSLLGWSLELGLWLEMWLGLWLRQWFVWSDQICNKDLIYTKYCHRLCLTAVLMLFLEKEKRFGPVDKPKG
jgi:hypothetical protein